MQTTNKGSRLMEPSAKSVLLTDLARWARRHALALAFSLGLILLNLISWLLIWLLRIPGRNRLGMPLSDLIIRQASRPFHGQGRPSLLVQFARLLVSLVITPGPLPLVIDVALVLVILCIAETRLGRRRTVLASVISAVGGAVVGLIICWLINALQDHWAWFIKVPMSLSPIILVVGSLMASIPFSDFLWRRRIATIGYTALILMVLYTGNPGSYCALAAALIGHLTGHLWHGPVQDANPHGHSGSYETRHLLGAVATVLALGPLVTVSSRIRAGFLTPLGTFMGSNTGGSAALSRCLAENNQVSCYAHYGLVAGHAPTGISSLIMPTLVMLVAAWGIYHGRRVAAVTGVVLNALTIVMALLYFLVFPLTIGEGLPQAIRHGALPSLLIITLPPLILSWFLVRNLGIFLVRTKTSRLQLGWAAIVLAFLATAMGYMAFTAISPGSFNPRPTTSRALSQLPSLYLPNGVASRFLPALVPRTPTGRMVSHGIGLIFWLVVLVVLLSWMRSSVIQNGSERQEADKLVEYGGESMSFMTTWEGNSYWFSPSGRSGIAYRLLHGIALTTT
ncbi:MAG: hypothetical protein M3Z43_05310, partial [Bifidobacterium sp.]|nr:hypothetical protein [Bifidobacterium sp.]